MESSLLSNRLGALKIPDISVDDLVQGAANWKFSFLGKVYSLKSFTVTELDKELKKLCDKSKDIFIKKEDDDSSMIKFYTQEEYEVVLKFRPWFIEGDLMALVPWDPSFPKSLMDLTKKLLWLRLYNMHPEFAYPPIVSGIASAMGEVKELDPKDCILPKGKVQKVLVLIDVRDPLRRGFWLKNAVDEDRGYLPSNSLTDPPSWNNPDSRGPRAGVAAKQTHSSGEQVPLLPSNVQTEQQNQHAEPDSPLKNLLHANINEGVANPTQ
ncbi:uncharacterized protein LOC113352321 [Papaver somniferum]|uniref:uncharacterized protein LOC113352321 n=1 Tax=Papaver somniferum TaxID=3469 RepID=UPI000E6F945E|nr:uncharacterized protein LOC113352321 [Papaver somniferum]